MYDKCMTKFITFVLSNTADYGRIPLSYSLRTEEQTG